uniref:Uncharacterized protein n=1 Tax=Siphoviridae sp. ctCsv15 TaxID=2826195 RepID=A0A8S5LZ20_9CAUD|nr:MAG TPA: hypothetical protein [Siphoviridae sp. ctCsv15]
MGFEHLKILFVTFNNVSKLLLLFNFSNSYF